MISEMQIHTIARQMIEKHGFEAIATAAQNAVACESKGDTEEARGWRHIEDAMKGVRGPHQGRRIRAPPALQRPLRRRSVLGASAARAMHGFGVFGHTRDGLAGFPLHLLSFS